MLTNDETDLFKETWTNYLFDPELLNESEQNFMEQVKHRFDQFGTKVYLSPKQLDLIFSISKKLKIK